MKLELFYPVKPMSINQAFGQNLTSVYQSQGMKGHSGIDFFARHGQPVYASHDGTCFPEIDTNGGNGVVIYSNQEYEYNGGMAHFKTIYWHLIQDDAVVHTGQVVKAGDLIGYADNTGISTGDHLHYGLKPCLLNEEHWVWSNVEQNNGYYGAIDPQPYFNGKFAEDINGSSPAISLFKNTLKVGMWNNDIKQLQMMLTRFGFPCGKTDGIFGQKTLDAVKLFQSKYGLKPDGLVGAKTQEKLLELSKI